MGGICSMSPVRATVACRTSASVTADMSHVPVTSPDESRVEVAVPRTISVVYVLGSAVRNRMSLVARPSPTNRMPVASGSRVPAWPTRRWPKMRRHRATAS